MSPVAYITLALVAVPSLVTLVWGVYIDHLRRQRRKRSAELRRACLEQRRQRTQALRPTGGSFRNHETSEAS